MWSTSARAVEICICVSTVARRIACHASRLVSVPDATNFTVTTARLQSCVISVMKCAALTVGWKTLCSARAATSFTAATAACVDSAKAATNSSAWNVVALFFMTKMLFSAKNAT